MKLRFLSLMTCLAMAIAVFVPSQSAIAGISSASTAQPRIAISSTGPSNVTVIWRLVRGGFGPGVPASTISSPSGTLTINGTVVGTVSRTLSRSLPFSVPPLPLTYTDTFVISQALAYRAIQERAPIVLTRVFTDTAGTLGGNPGIVTAIALITPSGPGTAQLNVSRLELSFDDRSRFKVLPKGSRLRAIAELNTTGVGLLEAQWEIATATTTAGTPVFRPLALVRQRAVGGRRTVITSPPLPTRFEGNNLVRLRLTDPETFFDEPELQYYVTPESPLPEKQEPRLMLITAPSPGTPLTLTTRFAWQAVPGAKIYKLEIFGAAPGPAENVADNEVTTSVPLDPVPDTGPVQNLRPLTGIMMPASITEVRLQDYTLAHLASDRRYQWMVKALGEDGAVIGVSPPREIYKP